MRTRASRASERRRASPAQAGRASPATHRRVARRLGSDQSLHSWPNPEWTMADIGQRTARAARLPRFARSASALCSSAASEGQCRFGASCVTAARTRMPHRPSDVRQVVETPRKHWHFLPWDGARNACLPACAGVAQHAARPIARDQCMGTWHAHAPPASTPGPCAMHRYGPREVSAPGHSTANRALPEVWVPGPSNAHLATWLTCNG